MDMNEILMSLGAVQNGNYFLMTCPVCGQKEAYCYIDDINKWNENHSHKIPIRCNRLNKCGKVSYLNDFFTEETSLKEIKIKEKNPIQMSSEGIQLLQTYCRYIVNAVHCNTAGFDFDIRGISNQTLKNHGIIYNKQTFQSLINQEESQKYFGKKYRNDNYLNRDIIIPIFNKNGIPERLLLRSTYHKSDKYKKEIQVMLVRRGLEIWNIQDLYTKQIIFVTEGVYDALSIKEVYPEAGVVAIPGIAKYKQLLILVKKENIQGITFVFCFDNDKVGIEKEEEAIKNFQKEGYEVSEMNLGIYKDCNEFLCGDKEGFSRNVRGLYLKALIGARKSKKKQNMLQ